MWTMLAGVPGKLKALTDRLTSTRADNLDKLDANISTRAPSSTALSTATWTSTRAGYLDRLDAAISTRAAATTALLNTVWTNTRAALIDRLDATISSRAPASTALSNAVWTNALATTMESGVIKSIQAGTSSTSSTSTGTSPDFRYFDVTVAAVNTSKTVVLVTSGGQKTGSPWANDADQISARLINSTTLRIHGANTGASMGASWQLVEFK